jgi:hypothetical protein
MATVPKWWKKLQKAYLPDHKVSGVNVKVLIEFENLASPTIAGNPAGASFDVQGMGATIQVLQQGTETEVDIQFVPCFWNGTYWEGWMKVGSRAVYDFRCFLAGSLSQKLSNLTAPTTLSYTGADKIHCHVDADVSNKIDFADLPIFSNCSNQQGE